MSPHDTDPPPPAEPTIPGALDPIPAGRAQLALASRVAVVARVMGDLEQALLDLDATAAGIARALDLGAKGTTP